MVDRVLDSIFGVENLQKFEDICKLLRIGLVSHFYHRKVYDKLLLRNDPSSKQLPDNSPLRSTALFTNPLVIELKKYVVIAMPWEDNSIYFKDATGLPPHVLLYADLKRILKRQDSLPGEIENKVKKLLDERTMNGQLSLSQLTSAAENGAMMKGLASDLAKVKRLLAAQRAGGTESGGP